MVWMFAVFMRSTVQYNVKGYKHSPHHIPNFHHFYPTAAFSTQKPTHAKSKEVIHATSDFILPFSLLNQVNIVVYEWCTEVLH